MRLGCEAEREGQVLEKVERKEWAGLFRAAVVGVGEGGSKGEEGDQTQPPCACLQPGGEVTNDVISLALGPYDPGALCSAGFQALGLFSPP